LIGWKTPRAVKTIAQHAFKQHFQDGSGQNQAQVSRSSDFHRSTLIHETRWMSSTVGFILTGAL